MNRMIRIMHCADLHLDSPFSTESSVHASVRRSELRGAFTSMLLYAKSNKADIVLMAGDLFDSSYATNETIGIMCREFAANPDCKFVISPGNHDPYTANSIYSHTEFPDNVYIFDNEQLSYFAFDDLETDVYGYAFTDIYMEKCPFSGCRPVDMSRLNLACIHADLTSPLSKKAPLLTADIAKSGFDYVALGHIHNSSGIEKAGSTYYGYSGCLEGRDYGETGYKGAVWVELDKQYASIKGVRFSKRRYESDSVDITGASELSDVSDKINRLIIDNKYGEDTLLKVALDGVVSPELAISKKLLASKLRPLYEFILVDKTLPLYDSDYLKNDPTVRGAFFEKLLPKLENSSAEEREIAALALRYGLAALKGNDLNF